MTLSELRACQKRKVRAIGRENSRSPVASEPLSCLTWIEESSYRNNHNLPMHVPLSQSLRALEISLEEPEEEEPWKSLDQRPEIGYGVDTIEEGLGSDVDGHSGDCGARKGGEGEGEV